MYESRSRVLRRIASVVYQYFNWLWLPSTFLRMSERFAKNQTQFLIIHSGGWPGPRSTLAVILACAFAGVRVGLVIHSYVGRARRLTPLQTAGLEMLLRWMRVPVAAVSADLQRHLLKRTHFNSVFVLENSIRKDFFGEVPDPQLPAGGQPIVLMTVGTLNRERSQRLVLEAIQLLAEELRGRVHYWLIGEGSEMEALRTYVSEHQLGNQVLFLGFKENIVPFLDATHLYVNPVNSYESFGLAMYEAMARGVPVLGSRIYAVPECVRSGHNGELFEPGSALELAAKIAAIVTDPVLYKRLSQGALETAQSVLPDRLMSRYLRFMERNA